MKISRHTDTTEYQHNQSCKVTSHHFENIKNIDCAIAEINGRYPTEGCATNLECSELAHVFSGAGKIVVNGKDIPLNLGDAILVEPGETFYWEGNMKLFIACSPAWYPEQHQKVYEEN